MISPVTFGAGPSTAPARPSAEEIAKRFESTGRNARAAASVGETRVQISAEGAQRAQADAQADALADTQAGLQAQQSAAAPDERLAADAAIRQQAQRPAPAPQGSTGATPARRADAPAAAAVESTLDLAFAAADGNRDGTVTISEQQKFEVRTVRLSIEQPSDGRPGPAGSGPIRAYLDVNATLASI